MKFSWTSYYFTPPLDIGNAPNAGDNTTFYNHPLLKLKDGDLVTLTLAMTFPGSSAAVTAGITPSIPVVDENLKLEGFANVVDEISWLIQRKTGIVVSHDENPLEQPVTIAVFPEQIDTTLDANGHWQTLEVEPINRFTTGPYELFVNADRAIIDSLGAAGVPYILGVKVTVDNPIRTVAPPKPGHFDAHARAQFAFDAGVLNEMSGGLSALVKPNTAAAAAANFGLKAATYGVDDANQTIAKDIGYAESVAKVTTTILGLADTAPQPLSPIALTLSVLSAIAKVGGLVLTALGQDPPDSDFTEVYVAQPLNLTAPGLSVVDKALITDLYGLEQDLLVMHTAAERFQGAELAGDDASQALQDAAFNAGQTQYAIDRAAVGADLAAFKLEMVAQSVADATMDGSDLADLKAHLSDVGLADPFFVGLIDNLTPLIGVDAATADAQATLDAILALQSSAPGGSAFAALDNAAHALSQAFNENNPPQITSNGGGTTATLSVAENTNAVTTVHATDPDVGTTLTYSIVGGSDAGQFAIDGSSGALSFVSAPDFEVPADGDHNNTYIVQVRVSDGSLTDDQTITVSVSDVNDPLPTVHWIASVDVGGHPAGWLPAGLGDFNKDGSSDLAWFNASTTDVDVWLVQNGHWAGSVDIGLHPVGYIPAGTGDFNHDGTSDVLWYNPTTRDTDIWLLSNGQWAGSTTIGTHPAGYQIAGIGDFNQDGTSDVVWYNSSTNDVDVWLVQNGHWAGSVDVGPHPAGYQIAGIGDFNHDGTSDVLWYNPTTHDTDIWLLNNGHWAGSTTIGAHPAGYQIAGTGDFNLDGTSDVVWYNPTTNDIDVWLVQNGHWAGSVDVGTHPAGSQLMGVGDFDHNGVADVMWRDTSSGHIETWLLAYS